MGALPDQAVLADHLVGVLFGGVGGGAASKSGKEKRKVSS
jgi:hypothetical protein